MGAAFLDLSTGEFRATEATGPDAWARICADLESYAPREILFPASLAPLIQHPHQTTKQTATLPLSEKETARAQSQTLSDAGGKNADSSRGDTRAFGGATLTALDDWQWQGEACATSLREQFGVRSLEGYGLEGKSAAVCAAGVCLRYAHETQRAAAAHVTDIHYFEPQDHLILDAVTVRNLELTESQGASKRASALLDVIDETVTGMGARLLRSWLLRPSLRRGEIEARQGAVADLYASQIKRDRLRAQLKEVADLERLTGRLNMSAASPRDLAALRRSLDQVPAVRQTISDSASSLLQILHESLDELEDVRSLIARAISDEPPAKLSTAARCAMAIRKSWTSCAPSAAMPSEQSPAWKRASVREAVSLPCEFATTASSAIT